MADDLKNKIAGARAFSLKRESGGIPKRGEE